MQSNQSNSGKRHLNLKLEYVAIVCCAAALCASSVAVATTNSPMILASSTTPKTQMKTIELELRLADSRLSADKLQMILEPETWIQKSSYDRYVFDVALWQQLKTQLKSKSSARVRMQVSAQQSEQYRPPAGTIAATPQGGIRIAWWKVYQFKLLK